MYSSIKVFYSLLSLIISSIETAPAPEYSEYSEDSIPMQWPPCYYDDWTPPMDYYQPCGNNINPAQAPPQQPDQDYWPGQIFPDCCTYECAPECFPGPEPEPPKPEPQPSTTTEETPPINQCPYAIPGWSIINERQIYLGSPSDQLSWFSAEAKAIEVGGHLLEIHSDEHNLLLDAVHHCYAIDTPIWIGGNDLAYSGNWAWSTGKPIEGYLNFESDPNYIDANGGECLDLILDGNFQWRKSQCSSQNVSHAFIAEKESSIPTSITTPSTTTKKATARPPYVTKTTTTTTTTKPTARPPYVTKTTSTTTTTTTKPTARPPYITKTTTKKPYVPTTSDYDYDDIESNTQTR